MAADAVSDIYNIREVDVLLLTSGQPTEAQLESVARAGVKVVISRNSGVLLPGSVATT